MFSAHFAHLKWENHHPPPYNFLELLRILPSIQRSAFLADSMRVSTKSESECLTPPAGLNLIPFFDICSLLAVLSPGLFGFVLLYLGHCAVATVDVCGFGRWFWCFTAGCHVKSPLFAGHPIPLKQTCAPRLEKAYKTVDFSQSNALRE